MNKNDAHANGWLWLTVPVAILLAVAAGSGLFISGLYRDTPNLVAQAMGQDAITLLIALPVLVTGAYFTRRGSQRARLIWLGAMIYVVYTYSSYAFGARFNPLFLVYVALLGCSTYALIGGFLTVDWGGLKAGFSDRTPVRIVSVFLMVIAALFYLLWLSEDVPASLTGVPPQSLKDDGMPTNVIHVLDMAWLLPALVLTAASLWRRKPIGYALAAALLTNLMLLTLAILSMILFQQKAGAPVAIPQVVIFAGLCATSTGMLVGYLKNLKSSFVTVP